MKVTRYFVGAILVAASLVPTTALAFDSAISDAQSTEVRDLAIETLEVQQHYDIAETPEARAQYLQKLSETATTTASEMGTSAEHMAVAWMAADQAHQTAVLAALTQLGVEYEYATSEPGVGMDCSGLTSYAWREAGFDIPNQSGEQLASASSVEMSEAMAGDIAGRPGHVMIYLGVTGCFVHAANQEQDVELRMVSEERADDFSYVDPSA